MRSAHSAIERPGAERAASDSEQANRIVGAPHFAGVLTDGIDQGGLKRQVRKADLPAFAALLECVQCVGRHRLAALNLSPAYAIDFAHHFGEQVSLIKLDSHRTELL